MTSHWEDPRSTSCAGGVPAALDRMRTQVQELCETLFAARGAGELMDGVAAVESLKSSLDALELGIVGELEATHAVKAAGWASTQDFVTAVAGGHKGTGPAVVRLARAVEQPLFAPLAEAMTAGWLSAAKAHVIQRAVDHLPGDTDLQEAGVTAMLNDAKALDASDLRKVGDHLVTRVDPSGDARREERELSREERSAHLGRSLSISEDGAGGAFIRGRCSSEDAAEIKAALFPLSGPRPSAGPVCDPTTCDVPGCGHDGRDPRDHGARMLDALVELCHRAQAAVLLPDCHGVTPRVTVTMSFEALKDQSGHGVTETGERLSATTVRRMACDAGVIPIVLGARSEVLDVGRLQRLVTPAIWKALVARDRHCRFPHCTRPPMMTHAHHLQHWAEGGPTSLDNLILLCGHHHRLVHAGPWTIRGTGLNDYAFDPPPDVARNGGRPPPTGAASR